MEQQKIESIEKGYGEGSTFYSINEKVSKHLRVDEIKEEIKILGAGYYNNLTLTVYRGYIGGKMVFEITSNSDITLRFVG